MHRCVAARLGRGPRTLPGFYGAVRALIIWFPADHPREYHSIEHDGSFSVDLRMLFSGSDHTDMCWFQLLSASRREARKLRTRNPDIELLSDDPDDDGRTDLDPDDDRTTVVLTPPPSPRQTATPMNTNNDTNVTSQRTSMNTNHDTDVTSQRTSMNTRHDSQMTSPVTTRSDTRPPAPPPGEPPDEPQPPRHPQGSRSHSDRSRSSYHPLGSSSHDSSSGRSSHHPQGSRSHDSTSSHATSHNSANSRITGVRTNESIDSRITGSFPCR